jgi:predicted Zn finger-like uncharacterized protein
MPSVIVCPSCAGQLRLPDDLIGQEVRCPTCSNVFTAATAPAAPPPAPEPRNGSHAPPDLSLEPATGRDPQPAVAPRGLVGAVEMKLSLDDDEPPGRAPARAPESPRPLPPERGDEPEGSLRPCPACARRIHRDSTRCYHCGWRLDGGPPERPRDREPQRRDREYENPYARRYDRDPQRRDREPHRGVLILVMGILSLVCLPLVSFVVPPVLGVVFGLVAWVMGHGDLKKIQANEMDPEGSGLTRGGWICGIIGTCLNTLLLLSCLGFISAMLLSNSGRPATTYKDPIQYKGSDKDIRWDDDPAREKDFPLDKGMRRNPPVRKDRDKMDR